MLYNKWIGSAFWGLVWCLLAIANVANADDNSQVWKPDITSATFPSVRNVLQFEDTSRVLVQSEHGVYLSKDSGKNWEKIELETEGDGDINIIGIQEFEFVPKAAMIYTESGRQFYTFDSGETWKYFDLPISNVMLANARFNYVNNDYILFEFVSIKDAHLSDQVFYSKDGLKTPPVKSKLENIGNCWFTKSNPYFKEGHDANIVCIQKGEEENSNMQNIISTTDFFETIEEFSDATFRNTWVMNFEVVKSFILLIVSSDRYLSDSTVLYTSKDGETFYRAFFETEGSHWRYSVLDSTENALYVSVSGGSLGAMQTDIFRSDSEGRYFRKIFKNVFSNILFMSQVSKVKMLDGVWIASHIDKDTPMQKSSKSMITYDDGETWSYLNITDSPSCNNDDECSLHISWLTDRSGSGSFDTGDTPGILVGVGNVGKYLEQNFENFKTFLSRDGGLTWKKVSDSPSVFAFGDVGNIIVLFPIDPNMSNKDFHSNVDYFTYSLDQGETWTEAKIGQNFLPFSFVNNVDDTDKTFVLFGGNGSNKEDIVYSIDFSSAFDKTCTDDDMEEWLARVDPITNKQVCVFGHSEKFKRRKIDAKCFVNRNYDDLKVIEEPCTCAIKDSECNSGFVLDKDGECQPVLALLAHFCGSETTVKLSKRRMIPGNLCSGGYVPPVDDYTLDCKAANDEKEKNNIEAKFGSFKEHIYYYQYLDKNVTKDVVQDETLIVITASRQAYISFDSNKFDLINDKSFVYVFTNQFWPDSVYLITDEGEIYGSKDRGRNFFHTVSPHVSNGYSSYSMNFDKKSQDTYLLVSNINCDAANNCDSYVSITEDNGVTFNDLIENANNCVFAESVFDESMYDYSSTEIICSQKVENQSYLKLISSVDGFASPPKELFEKIIGFATSGKYMIVASLNDEESLNAYVSVDGNTFAPVKFPHDVEVKVQTAYTILDVNSDQLFMHLTTFDNPDHEFGALLKANYNGTLFTTVINNVNRNKDAFVDFESVQTLEGLSIVNVIINPEEVRQGAEKKLVSKISHSDGATWSLLPPPVKDINGKRINCKGCGLHLHSYTERLDPMRDSFSSGSAVGMMFGLGNIGNVLTPLNDENNGVGLYFTKDAGITWKEIAKGHYIWEFGDQGTILVIAQTLVEVDVIKYSLDLGETWTEYKFTNGDKKYLIEDLATVPSDNSLKFILIIKDEHSSNSIVCLDFSSMYYRQCDLPEDTEKSVGNDFEYFTPKHPSLKSNCLFGHEKKYLRRKSDAHCFVGRAPLNVKSTIVRDCECTREDFECDYNFELSIDGTCRLVAGLEGLKGDEVCSNEEVNEWWEPTGYRKLELSTCEGGLSLDKWKSHPCPGKEAENVRIGGLSMFGIIFIPLLAFAIALTVVYERGIRRNGGFSRIGEIRLDEGDNLQLVEENRLDKVINTVIKVGVFSYQLMGKGWRFGTRLAGRFTGNDALHPSSGQIGAFFNDMVDDDHSLFGDLNDDEDAREIDSFLENGNDSQDVSDHDFDDFMTNTVDADDHIVAPYSDDPVGSNSPPADADSNDFRLSDDENGD